MSDLISREVAKEIIKDIQITIGGKDVFPQVVKDTVLLAIEWMPDEWRDAADEPPKEPGEVLIATGGAVRDAWYHGDGKYETAGGLVLSAGRGVTHWMPKPDLPEGER